jgi:hypothetical protein
MARKSRSARKTAKLKAKQRRIRVRRTTRAAKNRNGRLKLVKGKAGR